MGFRNRPRVPEGARLGRRVRPRRDRTARPRLPPPAVHPARRQPAQGHRPAQGRGQAARPMGDTPGIRLGRPGLRTAQARPAQRDSRAIAVGADHLRLPGTRHRQCRDHRALRHRRTEDEVPEAAARRRTVLVLLDDRTACGRGPDPVHHAGGSRRRRLGHQRLEVLLLQRENRLVPDRDGGDQPGGQRLPGHVDVPGAHRHTGREDRPQLRPSRRT